MLSACPLMHGTGQFSALDRDERSAARSSPCPSRHFDAAELWGEVERLQVNTIVIVGQAFAGPMLDELDAHPGALRPVERAPHHVVGRDVEPGEQGRPAAPHAPGASCSTRSARRRRSASAARCRVERRGRRRRRSSCSASDVRGVHRRRPPGRAGLRRAGHGRRQRLHPARLLQGRGEDGADVPHVRGPALERARRLGRGRAPTARCTCSAAARCASTPAARRSSPRRSRRC